MSNRACLAVSVNGMWHLSKQSVLFIEGFIEQFDVPSPTALE